MSMNLVFCPSCGAERSSGERFCRRCGTNLDTVERALVDSHTTQQPTPPTQLTEDPLKELRRETFWIAIRGIVTCVIAIPFFFLMVMVAARASPVGMITALVMLWFIVLGIRDLSRAYATAKDPRAALAKLKAQAAGQQSALPELRELANRPGNDQALKSTSTAAVGNQPETSAFDPTNAPPSVTEHTTFPLEKRKERDYPASEY